MGHSLHHLPAYLRHRPYLSGYLLQPVKQQELRGLVYYVNQVINKHRQLVYVLPVYGGDKALMDALDYLVGYQVPFALYLLYLFCRFLPLLSAAPVEMQDKG